MEDVALSLTPTETEALFYFIAERRELWSRVAGDFGVSDPKDLARKLKEAHAVAVQETFKRRNAI